MDKIGHGAIIKDNDKDQVTKTFLKQKKKNRQRQQHKNNNGGRE